MPNRKAQSIMSCRQVMKVHFEGLGDPNERTIIFVHGAGGSSASWFMQLRGLSERFNVVAVDLNGHGKTPDRNEVDTFHSYLEDIDYIINQYEKPFLGGHSMGGALTQLYALKHPERLSGIVLVGTGSRLRVHPMIFEMLQNNFEEYVEAAATFMFDESTASDVIAASQNEIRKCKPEIIARDFQACNQFDIMDEVSSIRIPALILVGENDQMTPMKYSNYLHERIEGSSLQVIPKAGHAVMLEQFEKLNEIIDNWIEEQNK